MTRTKSLLLAGTMLSAFMTGWFALDGLAAANLVVAQAPSDDDKAKGKAPPGRPGGPPPGQQRPAAPQQQAPQRPPPQQAPAQIQRPPQQAPAQIQQAPQRPAQAPPQMQRREPPPEIQRREPPPQMQRAAPPRDEAPPGQIQRKGPEQKALPQKGLPQREPGVAGRPGGLPPQGQGQRQDLRREGQRDEAPQRPGQEPGGGAVGQQQTVPGQRPGQPPGQPSGQRLQQGQQPGGQPSVQQLAPGQQPAQQQQAPGRQQLAPVIVPGQQAPSQQQPVQQGQQPGQPQQLQQGGQPAGVSAGAQQAAPERAQNLTQDVQTRRLDDVKRERRETREGNAVVIREPGRTIVREDNRTIIRHDETERFRRFSGGNVRSERRGNEVVTVTQRPGGVSIVTVVDADGRLIRRARRLNDGREVIIIDNSFGGRPPLGPRGYFVDIAPPVIRIPRERYIVEAEQADEEVIYGALTAPPVDYIERAYTLDEVRYSPNLRARMPAVDIDTINFALGSWEVTPDQIEQLAVIARAIKRAIGRNPNEVFLIEGHTDAVGSDVDNLSLSDRRAEAVATILTQDFQIPPENLTTQGYGEQYLKEQTDGPSRVNRRVTARRITPLLSGETGQARQ
jgi:outer membrane protein OmpA-like peptidoglycan-associated protein